MNREPVAPAAQGTLRAAAPGVQGNTWREGSQKANSLAELDWAIDLELLTSRAWVEIDAAQLRENLRLLQRRLGSNVEIWAVVKANAYGHGAQLVAPVAVAAGAKGLCVATLAEGIELRQTGLQAPILVLGALNTWAELQQAMAARLEVSLTCAEQIPLMCQVARWAGRPIPVHVNVDTGMTRLGIPWKEAAAVWGQICRIPELEGCSLFSHLATADEPHSPVMEQQHARFAQVVEQIRQAGDPLPALHLDNSAAALAHLHYSRVRLGLALYGLSPAPHLQLPGLQPILRLKARLTHIQTVPAQTGVSYGHRYITSRPSRIATLAIGYADGIPRRLSGWLRGWVRGGLIQQVGTITMDQCMWDVTERPDIQVGDVVELLGPNLVNVGLSVQDWADQLGTIPYELLCGLSARLPRVLVNPLGFDDG
ncbi:alanine racemase [Synechococcus sp. R55.2]|uniref:alanine racemase n=1 Tax=Synechococcus sp. R55.2 TaxID=2964496 RepID=UPI0039C4B240